MSGRSSPTGFPFVVPPVGRAATVTETNSFWNGREYRVEYDGGRHSPGYDSGRHSPVYERHIGLDEVAMRHRGERRSAVPDAYSTDDEGDVRNLRLVVEEGSDFWGNRTVRTYWRRKDQTCESVAICVCICFIVKSLLGG